MILVKGNNACNGGSTSAATSAPQFGLNGSTQAGISVLHCDISNNEDLEQFSQTVHDSFNGIDIVIDNATNNIFEAIRSDNFQTFIDVTSGKLRTTINVSFMLQVTTKQFYFNDFYNRLKLFDVHFQMLMHFIPKIKYSTCGHFVTIQPIISNKKPLLSSYGEIKTLINLLADNQSTFALDLFNRQQKIHLTTVMWNCDNRQLNTNEANCNGNNNIDSGGHSKIKEISERIINGIKADRSVVNINKSFSPFNSIRNYFRKKSANTLSSNCNNHKRVSWYLRLKNQLHNQTHNFSL